MKRIVSLLVSMLLMISAMAMPLTVLAEGEDGDPSYELDAHFNSQVGEKPTWIMWTYENDSFEIISESWHNITDGCMMIDGEGTTEETVFEYGKLYEYVIWVEFAEGEEKYIEINDIPWDSYGCASSGEENIMLFMGEFTAGYNNVALPELFSISEPGVNALLDESNFITVSDDENYVIIEQYWMDESGHELTSQDAFEANVMYTYYIEMEPKAGYKFHGSVIPSIDGANWCIQTNGLVMCDSGRDSFKYHAYGYWMCRDVVVSGLNNEAGQAPSWTYDFDEEEFSSVEFEWYNITDDCYMSEDGETPSETIFEEGKEYGVALILEPSDILASLERISVTGFKWIDSEIVTEYSEEGKFCVIFFGTFKAGDKPIGAFDLYFKDPIVAGGNLVYADIPEDLPVVVLDQFWSSNETQEGLPEDATFEAGKSYAYMIILGPKEGYFFDDNFSISGYDWEWTSGSFSSDSAAQVVSVKVEEVPEESTEASTETEETTAAAEESKAPETTAAEESKTPETTVAVEESKAPETTAAQSTTQAPTTAASGSKAPATGDVNNAFMYILLFAASIIVLGTSVYAVKKNK